MVAVDGSREDLVEGDVEVVAVSCSWHQRRARGRVGGNSVAHDSVASRSQWLAFGMPQGEPRQRRKKALRRLAMG